MINKKDQPLNQKWGDPELDKAQACFSSSSRNRACASCFVMLRAAACASRGPLESEPMGPRRIAFDFLPHLKLRPAHSAS